jgi:hypothetical protein
MTLFTMYIFSKRGSCLYYHEWSRPVQGGIKDTPEEDRKLMFGLLFSLKMLANKMNPQGEQATTGATQLPAFGPDQGFYRFATDSYVLWHLEAPTGYKIVLTSDAAAGDLRPALWTVYAEIFTNFALKNPLYVPGTPITNVGFVAAIDGFARSLPAFTAR